MFISDNVRFIVKLIKQANVKTLAQLKGVKVEVNVLPSGVLKSWKILESN